jgi:predicted HicB family RNase H-like nuclease
MWPMVASEFVKARLPLDLKRRVKALSERQLLSESAWLKRLVVREVQAVDGANAQELEPMVRACAKRSKEPAERFHGRVYVRLRKDDWLLLEARAAARDMRPATYVSALTRSHLRQLSPLPKDELIALRRSISELAAIGRNLNQIARSANEDGRLPGSAREDLRAMLKVCEALRDNTKALLKANLASWESGYGKDV